jgi:hypothetical protein
VVSVQSVIGHALYSHQSSFLEDPVEQILHNLLVSILVAFQSLVAEEEQGARKDSSGIVEALNSGSEGDCGASLDSSLCFLVFGEGSGFCLDEIVKLIIFIVDQVEANSLIEQSLLSPVMFEERLGRLIVKSFNGLSSSMIVKMIFQPCIAFFKLNSKGIEEFSVRERSIYITDDNDISSLVEVRDDILHFQLAVEF